MASDGERLHPWSLLFGLGPSLRSLLLPALAVLVTARRSSMGWEAWAAVLLLPAAVATLVRYLSLTYRIAGGELVIRTGLLFTNERHVPCGRIHNVDVVQNPLHRVLGVAEVRIQTAGGEEPEARLRVISTQALEELRRAIAEGRGAPTPSAVPGAAATGARVIHAMSPRDLVLLGLIENRGMLVVAAAGGLIWESGVGEGMLDRFLGKELSSGGLLRRVAGGAVAGRWPDSWEIAAALGGLLGLLLVVRLLSVAWVLVRQLGWTVTRDGDDLRLGYGSLTRVSASIPIRRIQRITVRETPLRRLFSRASVRVESAGGIGEQAGQERLWLAPLIRRSELAALLRELDPALVLDELPWQSLHPGAERRVRKPLVWLVAVGALLTALPTSGVSLALALPLAVLAAVHARRWTAAAAWAVTDDLVAFRSGWLYPKVSAARHAKVQAVTLSASPFDRRRGMASVAVDTAGAGDASLAIDVPYLDATLAAGLHARLAAQAAGSAFRW